MEKQTFDMHKIYTTSPEGYAEYMGGTNFLNGKKTCPNCKGSMVREPLGIMFVRTNDGKILVNVSQTTGRMVAIKEEPDYQWQCTDCGACISRKLGE